MPSQGFPRDWRRHQTKERVVMGWRGMGAERPGDTGSGGVMPLTGRLATCTCNLPPRPGMTRRCEAPSRGRAWQRDSVTPCHVTSVNTRPRPARVSRPAPPAAALTNLSSGPQSPLHRGAERMSRHSAWHVTPPRDLVTVILSPQPQWRRMRHSILATKKPLRILTEWEVCVSGELRRTFSFYRIIIWEKESINSTLVPLMYKFKLKTENWQCKLAQATLSVLYVLMVSYKNPAFSYTYHIISMRR